MHLLASLTAGIVGAPNGTVQLFQRGTLTRASWWNTFEGDVVSTADITLDGNGSAEVYVTGLTDVVVRDTTGTTVRTYTEGAAAGSIEVISESFTGHDYVTAALAANEPTTLQAVLDLVKVSFGTTDFNILINGVPTTIQDAIAGRQFFNVKDPLYGATGDGTTDDTAAIQAALDDARDAGGGVVFFPGGEYMLGASLTYERHVSLMGVGSDWSILKLDHATIRMFIASGSATNGGGTFMAFLQLKHVQACTGTLIDLTGVTREHAFYSCVLGGSLTAGTVIDRGAASAALVLLDCKVRSKAAHIKGTDVYASRCTFTMNTVAAATLSMITVAGRGRFDRCEFYNVAATTSTLICIEYATGANGSVNGCFFDAKAATSTVYGMGFTGAGHVFAESGNAFQPSTSMAAPAFVPSITPYFYSVTNNTATEQRHFASRNCFNENTGQSGGGTKTLNSDQYAMIQLGVTDNTNFTLQLAKAPLGAELTVVIYGAHGSGTGTITWGTFVFAGGTFAVATTKNRIYHFRMGWDSISVIAKWILVAATTGDL